MELCAICLETDGELKTVLPCGHSFHTFCLTKYIICNHWNGIDANNRTPELRCPYCRKIPFYDLEKNARVYLGDCSRIQLVHLRDYFNQRMFENIKYYANLRIKNKQKQKKFIFNIYNTNCITLRYMRDLPMWGARVRVYQRRLFINC